MLYATMPNDNLDVHSHDIFALLCPNDLNGAGHDVNIDAICDNVICENVIWDFCALTHGQDMTN